jgi:hypothetical protein
MVKRSLVLAMGIAAVCAVGPVAAHHSFAATYFVDQSVTIEGTVAQFLFRNPHSFIHIEVKDPKDPSAKPVRWSAEWAAGTQLGQQGVGREVLKAGDHVILTGNPGRREVDRRIRLEEIVRPSDGWRWKGTFD